MQSNTTALIVVLAVAGVFCVVLAIWYGVRVRFWVKRDPAKRKSLIAIMNAAITVFGTAFLAMLQQGAASTDEASAITPTTIAVYGIAIGVALLSVAVAYSDVVYGHEESAKTKRQLKNERAANVLSHVQSLCDHKSNLLRKKATSLEVTQDEWPYFYDCKDFLMTICDQMRHSVANAIGAEAANVDVSLIYQFGELDINGCWEWVVSRSGLSGIAGMDGIVRDPSTLFNYMLRHKGENSFFCNDKTNAKHYTAGTRDRLYDMRGSYYAQRVDYESDQGTHVTAILFVSTFGVYFVDPKRGADDATDFQRALKGEILPPFVSMIEIELGNLYLRRNWNKLVCYDTKEQFAECPVVEIGPACKKPSGKECPVNECHDKEHPDKKKPGEDHPDEINNGSKDGQTVPAGKTGNGSTNNESAVPSGADNGGEGGE